MKATSVLACIGVLVAACRPDPQETAPRSTDGGCVESPFAALLRRTNEQALARVEEIERDYLPACLEVAKGLGVEVNNVTTIDGCVGAVNPKLGNFINNDAFIATSALQCDLSIDAWRDAVRACASAPCDVSSVRCTKFPSLSTENANSPSLAPLVSCPGSCTPAPGRTSVSCSRHDACSVTCTSSCGATLDCNPDEHSCACAGACKGTAAAPVICDGICTGSTPLACRNSYPASDCEIDLRCRGLATAHVATIATCSARSFDVRRMDNGERFSPVFLAALEKIDRGARVLALVDESYFSSFTQAADGIREGSCPGGYDAEAVRVLIQSRRSSLLKSVSEFTSQ